MQTLYEDLICQHCDGEGTIQRVNGAYIREIRERSGRSLRQVAREIGVSPAYLSDMELGRRGMSEEIAQRILQLCSDGGE